jgi:hypothetical protein
MNSEEIKSNDAPEIIEEDHAIFGAVIDSNMPQLKSMLEKLQN